MSDELVVPVQEGEIVVDEAPFTSEQDARHFVTEALVLWRQGIEKKLQGEEMLDIAERRLAWKALGYTSWRDCLSEMAAEVYNLRHEAALRLPIVVDMRMQSIGTAEIAAATGVHRETVRRDLIEARSRGLLGHEPDKVMTTDRRVRPTRPTASQNEAAKARRPDLVKPWRNRVDELRRSINGLRNIREDDRYAGRLEDLTGAGAWWEISEAHRFLGEVLEDMKIIKDEDPNANEDRT